MIQSGAFAAFRERGLLMDNLPEDKLDKSKQDEQPEAGTPEPDTLPSESDEGIPVSEETRGNRAEEKVEKRVRKKQETREEAKSITGSQAHHDPRNEHPDSGPAPLDRY
jgi:hypothetical protein